jgi:hypothetical protein
LKALGECRQEAILALDYFVGSVDFMEGVVER